MWLLLNSVITDSFQKCNCCHQDRINVKKIPIKASGRELKLQSSSYIENVFALPITDMLSSFLRSKVVKQRRSASSCSWGACSTWSATFTSSSSTPTCTWRKKARGNGPSLCGWNRYAFIAWVSVNVVQCLYIYSYLTPVNIKNSKIILVLGDRFIVLLLKFKLIFRFPWKHREPFSYMNSRDSVSAPL